MRFCPILHEFRTPRALRCRLGLFHRGLRQLMSLNCPTCAPCLSYVFTFLVGCWTVEENTQVLKGQKNSAASVEDCLAACINDAHCEGMDWNPQFQAGSRCWLNGPRSGRKVHGKAGITHYTFNRKCAGKNLSLARSFHVSFAKRTFQFNSKFVN